MVTCLHVDSGSRAVECEGDSAELATYSGDDCTGNRTAQSLADGCIAFGDGYLVYTCNSSAEDDVDDGESDSEECFSLSDGSCSDEPSRRSVSLGLTGCGCVTNSSK